jgi:monovalent cation:H+ antiporter-2, CPA2 family
LLVTPVFARAGQRLNRWLQQRDTPAASSANAEEAPPEVSGHVVVIGFGRMGQLLGELFTQQRVRFIAVEHNMARVSQQRQQGVPIYYGNAARTDLLHKLALSHAACLVVTMDKPQEAMQVVRNARQQYPDLAIYARSHDEAHARALQQAGATDVVPEMLEAGLQLGTLALESLGLPDGDVHAIVALERERRQAPVNA